MRQGPSGGLALANEIGIGEVMHLTKKDFALVECFGGGVAARSDSKRPARGANRLCRHDSIATPLLTLADLMVDPAHCGIAPAP